MTAGGPDKGEMSPILILRCAPAGQAGTVHRAKAAKARSNNAIPIFPRGDAELPRRVIVALPRDFWKGKSRSRVPDARARTGHPADKVGSDPAARVDQETGPGAPLAQAR